MKKKKEKNSTHYTQARPAATTTRARVQRSLYT
jgi:hypothetical protein